MVSPDKEMDDFYGRGLEHGETDPIRDSKVEVDLKSGSLLKPRGNLLWMMGDTLTQDLLTRRTNKVILMAALSGLRNQPASDELLSARASKRSPISTLRNPSRLQCWTQNCLQDAASQAFASGNRTG